MKFGRAIEAFADGFIDGSEAAVRGATIKLWNSITLSSPVDSGRFRANWVASYDGYSGIVNSFDKSGSKTTARNAQAVLNQKEWDKFTLTNNLPYADVIEYGGYGNGDKTSGGYSKQAPQGVVRVNVKRFNSLLAKEAAKELPK